MKRLNLDELLMIFFSILLVTVLWQWLEIITLKEIVENKVDTIIAIVLGWSLYTNLKFYIKSKVDKDIK